jgi:hypothetical protein
MTQEKGWLGPYPPADTDQVENTMDIVNEVKAIFDEKNNIINRLRGVIDGLVLANKDLQAWYDSLREDAKRLLHVMASILSACEDVNSPDRKVREEIAKYVRKALKESE